MLARLLILAALQLLAHGSCFPDDIALCLNDMHEFVPCTHTLHEMNESQQQGTQAAELAIHN